MSEGIFLRLGTTEACLSYDMPTDENVLQWGTSASSTLAINGPGSGGISEKIAEVLLQLSIGPSFSGDSQGHILWAATSVLPRFNALRAEVNATLYSCCLLCSTPGTAGCDNWRQKVLRCL